MIINLQLSSTRESRAFGQNKLLKEVTQEHKTINLEQRHLENLSLQLHMLWRLRFQGRGRRNSDNVKNKPSAETIFSFLLTEIMAWGAQQELPGDRG